MTLDAVRQAKLAIEAEGGYPSVDKVLERLGHGSKRDALVFMRLLRQPPSPGAAVEEKEDLMSLGETPAPSPLHEAHKHLGRLLAEDQEFGGEQQAFKAEQRRLQSALRWLEVQTRGVPSEAQAEALQAEKRALEHEWQTHQERFAAWRGQWQTHCQQLQAAQLRHRTVCAQAQDLLQAMRHAQAQAAETPYERVEHRHTQQRAQGALALVIGAEEAQRLADDRSQRGSWQGR